MQTMSISDYESESKPDPYLWLTTYFLLKCPVGEQTAVR